MTEYYHIIYRPKDPAWVVMRDGAQGISGVFPAYGFFTAKTCAEMLAGPRKMGIKIYDQKGDVIETIAPEDGMSTYHIKWDNDTQLWWSKSDTGGVLGAYRRRQDVVAVTRLFGIRDSKIIIYDKDGNKEHTMSIR